MSEDLYTPAARSGGIKGSLRLSPGALAMLVALASGMPLPSLPPQAGVIRRELKPSQLEQLVRQMDRKPTPQPPTPERQSKRAQRRQRGRSKRF